MFNRLGLRSEITLQLFLLMAASIVFISLLITKVSEQELLHQRIIYNINLLELIEKSLDPAEISTRKIDHFLQKNLERFDVQHGLHALAIIGPDKLITKTTKGDIQGWPDKKESQIAGLSRNITTKVSFHGFLQRFFTKTNSFLLVTVPINSKSSNHFFLQAYFSLDDIPSIIFRSHAHLLPYIFIVGLILVLFGSYLLGKIVVKPIKSLQLASQNIASGNLEQSLTVTGPKEIYQLLDHFNDMSHALQMSRKETEAHIQSLKQINKELEQTRTELIQSEKMASIGHLAAGIAHEIGNPLGALLGYQELLLSQQDPATREDILNRSLHEAKRIDQLVRDLLDYARPGTEEDISCDVTDVLSDTVSLLDQQRSLPTERLSVKSAESLPALPISKRKLQQVLINLLLNARDASPTDEQIQLEVRIINKWVQITVRDSGAGIPENKLSSIFDPFYTTKKQGEGRGLGLFIAHRIISDAGGRIEVESENQQGTSFSILLPSMESCADAN